VGTSMIIDYYDQHSIKNTVAMR